VLRRKNKEINMRGLKYIFKPVPGGGAFLGMNFPGILF
jgi:hypothetical protein